MNSSLHPGRTWPLGATPGAGGANFSLYSREAARVDLLLFDRDDDAVPARTIALDPQVHRTYHYWHAHVPGVTAGQMYGYRVTGPFDPARGQRCDPAKLLLDPYGRGVAAPKTYDRHAAAAQGQDNAAVAMKSVVIDAAAYDWEGDEPLRRPAAQTIIYEMHVRGFTAHPNSGVSDSKRGTYAGLIQKIPYLQALGITAVELLPVFQFDAQDCPKGLVNYWGYQPVSFFAPHLAYSAAGGAVGAVNEFRDMVKALHRAGIEVILDVVFNHTTEGGDSGPTLCFRGIDNPTYYTLESGGRYANYSGCGNTLNANHPIVRRMIVDSICYWVEEMHVDGFRFDLASILSRDHQGHVLPNPPALWDLESHPALAGTKLIAEAWDAAGLYQVGSFVGDAWKEWNGRFRDDVRSFFRAERGSVRHFADRLTGSQEIYGHKWREPEQSVNFVTCHDGFTLNDLVCYDHKHNDANNENNRDGHDDNRSWNCGVEGPSDNREIESLRNRQIKNFLATTLLSIGMPMILMGDEVRRTQGGNNNNYCHDDESNWFDWSLITKHADVHRFVALLNARRRTRSTEHELKRVSLNELLAHATRSWHGVKPFEPDWGDSSHALAFHAHVKSEGLWLYLMFNSYWEALDFELPRAGEGESLPWRRWIDTARPSPEDICAWQDAKAIDGWTYRLAPRSVVALLAQAT